MLAAGVVEAGGVETEAQPKLLSVLRCDQIQGYLVSKPLAIDDMMAFLSRTRKQARK